MNSHNPFDACQNWGVPSCGCGNSGCTSCNQSNDPLVDKMIGNAYHVVRTVYCNLGNLKLIYDFLNQYGMVLGVQSEDELKALTTKAEFARIYGFDNTNKRQVTDYLYVEGDRTGILPDDPTATGSWVEVATSNSGGGGDDDGKVAPPYIPYVYNDGAALGGETTIPVPSGTVGVPFIIVEGYTNTVGYGFTYDATSLTVTLAQPLEVGDEVVLLLTGTPAVPDNPNVTDWIQINWLYNGGYAIGDEQVIAIPYTFQSVPAIYRNGARYYAGLAERSYTVDAPNQRILLTEPLVTNDRLIVTIGGESTTLIMSDRTLQEVARAANVKDSETILSSNTTQYLNGMKVIYDVVAQKSYGLPALPPNVYISSVSNGQLTYSPGNIVVDLVPVPGSTKELEEKLSSESGASLINTTQGSTVQEQLDILNDIKHSDISNYGYVYGSGTDAKNYILASIADNGEAHISGAVTLSRFDWPQGARLLGKGTITYTRLPTVACELDSNIPVNHSVMKAVYVHQVFDICDMLQLKTAGFNTLIHYGQWGSSGGDMTKACNAAEAVGLKLILGGPIYGQTDTPSSALDGRDCVIGYYLFDEPQNQSISAASQATRINAFKAFTTKSLVIADNGIFSFDNQTIPSGYDGAGYDLIFIDAYAYSSRDSATNKRTAVLGWAEMQHKSPNSKILPCLGMFTDPTEFSDKQKQIKFAREFFGMGDASYAAFAWESHLITSTFKDITNETDFYKEIKSYNTIKKQKPYHLETIVFYTDKMGGAMQLYNDKYSSVDVTPWQTVNTGSATSERNTTFKQGGIAVKNAGGILATTLKNYGYLAVELYYFNGADSSNTVAAITTCIDDFYTNTDQLTFTFSSTQGAWINAVELTPNLGIGIRLSPVTSYQWRWKMVRGGIVDCSWRGSTF